MKKLIKLIGLTVLSIFAISILTNTDTFAITKTWTGGGDGVNFSDGANWSDETVPQNGDDLVFEGYYMSIMADMPGLQVNSVEYVCGSSSSSIVIEGSLVVIDSIFYQNNDPESCDSSMYFNAGLNLVSDLSVTNVHLSPYSGSSSSTIINLNSYTLNLSSTINTNINVMSALVGSGTVNINGVPSGDASEVISIINNVPWNYPWILLLGDQSNFTGTINVNARFMLGAFDMFTAINPAATININPDGLLFMGGRFADTLPDDWYDPPVLDGVFANPINIYRPGLSLFVLCIPLSSNETCQLFIPNITLYTSTTFFAVDAFDDLSVDLTGITTNGYCITYEATQISEEFELTETIIDGSALFTGGPDETCEKGSGPTDPENPSVTDPDAPNTGELMLNNKSLLIIAGTISLLIIGLAYKLRVARANR